MSLTDKTAGNFSRQDAYSTSYWIGIENVTFSRVVLLQSYGNTHKIKGDRGLTLGVTGLQLRTTLYDDSRFDSGSERVTS